MGLIREECVPELLMALTPGSRRIAELIIYQNEAGSELYNKNIIVMLVSIQLQAQILSFRALNLCLNFYVYFLSFLVFCVFFS